MGLPGFGDAKTFVLLDHRPGSVFRWLQALERPELAFVVIDPLLFVEDYPLDSVRRSAAFAGIDPEEDLVLLVICTVPAQPAEPTANFMAPIGVGRQSRRGAQVVMHDSGLGSAQPFLNRSAATG